jgi:hypothetical protein
VSIRVPMNGHTMPPTTQFSPPVEHLCTTRARGRKLATVPNYRMMIVLLLALGAQARQVAALQVDSRAAAVNEYLVVGTVVWVHAESSSIAIRGAGLLGHLRLSVKSYQVKQASAIQNLQPGDAITAVFSTRDGMLHRVRRVRAYGKNTSAGTQGSAR